MSLPQKNTEDHSNVERIVPVLTPQDRAQLVYTQYGYVADQNKLLDELKADLLKTGEGKTFTINDKGGKVQITTTSPGGPNGKVDAKFDLVAFSKLPKALQLKLQKAGVVSMEPGVTRGVAAQVKVTFR